MESQEKLNDRQRKFAELIVGGATAKAAYFEAFPRCRSEKTAETEGSKLLKNPKVASFIEALRWEVAENAKSDLVATRQEVLEFLTEVIRTPAGMVDEEHKLCQSFKFTEGMREIKIPPKLQAAERLAKMLGWDVPEKKVVEAGDTLTEFLEKLLGGSK
ncbi:phage terminase, small subunit [Terrimicrobium sacchariphilum]|uniref:Phage terminase, small subunit n=1 Tax=Terrimicrobium sacchariphilum TaxID=690879 RepID=A0A146GGP3_TERSA|nr:terminase small subunit [Terrimicrobium sacchariphilum]GAT35608.1 phage terminase, small subunit [Terrimicrobium sacchariphilum]